MTAGDFVQLGVARKIASGRVGEFDAYCPDCGAAYQEVGDGFRCPWATSARRRLEHDDPEPGFTIVACGRA